MIDEKRRWRRAYVRLWEDPDFQRLSDAEKVMATYLLFGPQTNRIGLFKVSIGLGSEHLKWASKLFRERLERVCQSFRWELDHDVNVVWIPSWWDYNPPTKNENNMSGALTDISEVPSTHLISKFASHLAFVPPGLHKYFTFILNRYAARTPSGHRSNGVATQEKEKEKEQEQEKEQDVALMRECFGPTDLLTLWNEIAKGAGLRPCLALSGDRLTHARTRLREQPERAYWESVIRRIASSGGCRGQNDRNWIADMDFLLRKSTHVKVLEGKYDQWGVEVVTKPTLSKVTESAMRAIREAQ